MNLAWISPSLTATENLVMSFLLKLYPGDDMNAEVSASRAVSRAANKARPWAIALARAGHTAKGIVYIIIGFLAFQAAFGMGGQTTDSRGALQKIVQQPFGRVLLSVVGIGLLSYALWRVVQAYLDPDYKGSDAKGLAKRFGYVVSGLAYGGLALTAFRIVSGNGGSKSSQQDWTAKLLAQPLGQLLVGMVGVVIVGLGLSAFYKAASAKFREHLKLSEMSQTEETWITGVGRAGYAARGVVLAIVGWFFIQAARHANPKESRGLDQALDTLAQQPHGRWLLGIVAAGLAAYGIYTIAEARYRRIYRND
jgi:hypothetical protein